MEQSLHFTVHYEGEIYRISSNPYEYRSLMALLYDKIYVEEEFGECKGMGRCGTCIIKILNSDAQIRSLNRNEDTTLTKMGVVEDNIHLSCQIELNEQLNGLEIEILSEW